MTKLNLSLWSVFKMHQSFCWPGAVAVKLGTCHTFELTHSNCSVLKPDEFTFISDTCCCVLTVLTREDVTECAVGERKPMEGFCAFTMNLTIVRTH